MPRRRPQRRASSGSSVSCATRSSTRSISIDPRRRSASPRRPVDGFPPAFVRRGIACRASEALALGHGLCFAKSHLLAALLRFAGHPTGFCYVKLVDDDKPGRFVLHGFVAVHWQPTASWILLDPRGNRGKLGRARPPGRPHARSRASAASRPRSRSPTCRIRRAARRSCPSSTSGPGSGSSTSSSGCPTRRRCGGACRIRSNNVRVARAQSIPSLFNFLYSPSRVSPSLLAVDALRPPLFASARRINHASTRSTACRSVSSGPPPWAIGSRISTSLRERAFGVMSEPLGVSIRTRSISFSSSRTLPGQS